MDEGEDGTCLFLGSSQQSHPLSLLGIVPTKEASPHWKCVYLFGTAELVGWGKDTIAQPRIFLLASLKYAHIFK